EVAVEPIVEAALEPVAAVVPDPVVAVAHEPIVAADEPVEETVIEPAAEIFSEPVAGAASAPAFGYPLDAVPVFAREMLAHRPDDHGSTPVEPTVPLQPEPEPAAQPEPIAELEPERQHNEWGPIAAAVEPIENIEFVEAPIATVELTEPVEQILEEAPKIAALAETLETARVEEILEQAPKIAALVETIEVARIGDVLQEVQAAEAAVVIPMTRTVRIEVPPRTAPTPTAAPPPIRGASNIDRLLRVASARGASALFLTSDSRPCIRLEGDLRFLDSEASLSRADVEGAIVEIAPQHDRQSIGRGEAAEWIAEVDGVGRIRCTTFSDYRGPGMIMRLIATRAATAEQLGLAREIQALATEPQGLVLVAGPRGSGKSTMISALVDLVNRQRAEYVITLERQIRLVHDNRVALVSQREIPGAVEDSVAAARSALRETPDVLVVDDLLSPHMVPVLLSAASEGLLIFVSITAPSTADAVARFVELAPPETRKAVQNSMAESFRGAVAQVLLKKAGGGLVAAREILLATSPVTRVISEGQHAQLPLALENGRKHGMVSFTDTLADFVRSGTVDVREAFRKAPDRPRLLDALKRHGVDTTIVERLA
ncbi:MAG TPA: ATPase, T2SS/T4P/T4SS family, partial [Vicinamibacterales bacterium]|nr:ATPase, T2SS/T4P/T4SS family [Vicinamibacterales bacterium]